jgi:hypothetical protein
LAESVKQSLQPSRIGLWLAALAYIGFFLSLSNVPFLDAPNHLARAVIMKSLWLDPHSPFQGAFSARHFFMPYILPDLGLILLLQIFGAEVAYPVWSTLTVLALASAIWFYARQLLATSWAIAAAVFCSWYFATNYLFILGFFSFEWGLAAAFVALGALESWRRNKGSVWIVLYVAACAAAYGAHLASFAILAALAAAIGFIRVLRNQQRWTRFAWELLPFAMLAAYHFLVVPAHPEAVRGTIAHSSIPNKMGRFFGSIFIRQTHFTDLPLLILFLGIIAGALSAAKARWIDLTRRWELAAVCGLAAIGYFLLPIGMGAGWYIDERLLPFFFIPLLMFALSVLESSGPSAKHIRLLIFACCLLTAGNLASLARFLPTQNREVGQYREALRAIPAGKILLPVDTRRSDARTRPLLHADSLYVVDRYGYTPYLFSAKTGGGPAGYFSDLYSMYRPDQSWYQTELGPDWDQVIQTYDYVIVTKPWRAERIDRSRLALFYENSVATVFRVTR